MSAKIAVFDIETFPATAYTFGPKYEARLMKELTPIRLASFAYKDINEKKVHCFAQPDFETYKELVQKLWELFDMYDILIAHNGKKFDVKQSNTFFLEEGLTPPSPYKIVDTILIARKHFKLPSYALKELLSFLHLPQKMETGGEELWFSCMQGDAKAWKKMKAYNANDVYALELLYKKLLGWTDNHPNVALFEDLPVESCKNCNSNNSVKRGFHRTVRGKKQIYQCTDCGSWFTSRTLIPYELSTAIS